MKSLTLWLNLGRCSAEALINFPDKFCWVRALRLITVRVNFDLHVLITNPDMLTHPALAVGAKYQERLEEVLTPYAVREVSTGKAAEANDLGLVQLFSEH